MDATVTTNMIIAGQSFSSSNIITDAEGSIGEAVNITAGQSGTLSTRTSDTVGTLTLGTDHGITTGQKINIYWIGGARYNVTVGTVSGTSVPFTLGLASSDVLPTQATVIVASPVTLINIDFVANDLQIIAALSTVAGTLIFLDSGDLELLKVTLYANNAWGWDDKNSYTNPMSGDTVASAIVATSGVTAGTFKLSLLYNSVA